MDWINHNAIFNDTFKEFVCHYLNGLKLLAIMSGGRNLDGIFPAITSSLNKTNRYDDKIAYLLYMQKHFHNIFLQSLSSLLTF